MAKFLPILGALRGAIADLVFSRNKGGQYAKQKASPTNPNSVRQQTMRGILAQLSAAWDALTDPQKSAWNGWADSNPRTDSLGQEYTLTGHQAFVGLNARVLDAGDTIGTDPPDQGAPPPAEGVVITYTDGDTISVAFTHTVAADERLYVWMSMPQSASGDPNLAQARMVGFSALAAATPVAIDIPFEVIATYTVNFWVGNYDTHGQLSVPVKIRETR